jgi:hypothetical protein
MTELTDGARAVRRACIERSLADYPHLTREDVADVLHWFRKEASALDVALLATNQDIAEKYRRFRADHVDRLSPGDIVRAIVFVVITAAIIALIAWRAL